jgi:UDP-N-acetylmuramate--alanine ligase
VKIHFIGIGGIGVSALAQYYLSQGDEVSGSDLVSSEITEMLVGKGAKVVIGKHSAKNVPKDAKMAVYSPAVEVSNPEFKKAKARKMKLRSYPEALGELTKEYFTIAVSVAHGKSTTTALISLILTQAGLNPTVIVGTKIKEFGNTNFRAGKGKYLVIEADEWNASFLNYWPRIIVLTNIEAEHLDFYKNLENIMKTFDKYISHLPEDGILVANADDENIIKLKMQKVQRPFKIQNYSLKQGEAEELKKIMQIPGKHNISNALAALEVARLLGVQDRTSFSALSKYQGAWRRFDMKETEINGKKFTLVSDYGHHPTEIRVTLEATREKFPDKKIWCVFQPHQFQRTFYLFDDFVKVFKNAPINNIIITDIYSVAGRESSAIKKKVNSKKLVKKIEKPAVIYLKKNKIKDYLKNNLEDGSVVVVMGAGDIYELTKDL